MKTPGQFSAKLNTVRYRGPNGQEWSGRGRPPAWIITHEAKGGNREAFLIE